MMRLKLCFLLTVVLGALFLSGCGSGSDAIQTADSAGRLSGNWGAKDTSTEIRLTSTGGRFNELGTCFKGDLSGPIVPDSSGAFSVAGSYSSNIGGSPVHFVGTVKGNVMKLSVIYDNVQTFAPPVVYTLILGQSPLPYTTGCPG